MHQVFSLVPKKKGEHGHGAANDKFIVAMNPGACRMTLLGKPRTNSLAEEILSSYGVQASPRSPVWLKRPRSSGGRMCTLVPKQTLDTHFKPSSTTTNSGTVPYFPEGRRSLPTLWSLFPARVRFQLYWVHLLHRRSTEGEEDEVGRHVRHVGVRPRWGLFAESNVTFPGCSLLNPSRLSLPSSFSLPYSLCPCLSG